MRFRCEDVRACRSVGCGHKSIVYGIFKEQSEILPRHRRGRVRAAIEYDGESDPLKGSAKGDNARTAQRIGRAARYVNRRRFVFKKPLSVQFRVVASIALVGFL